MTRKDYELIAGVIRKFPKYNSEVTTNIDELTYSLGEALSKENPRFDRLTFLMASGVQDTTLYYRLNQDLTNAKETN